MSMFASRTPRGKDAVVTSVEVLERGLPVTRVMRYREFWMFLSGYESDESEPIEVHFSHVTAANVSLWNLPLRPLQYALRGDASQDWVVFGPVRAEDLDRALMDGTIDSQQEELRESTET